MKDKEKKILEREIEPVVEKVDPKESLLEQCSHCKPLDQVQASHKTLLYIPKQVKALLAFPFQTQMPRRMSHFEVYLVGSWMKEDTLFIKLTIFSASVSVSRTN